MINKPIIMESLLEFSKSERNLYLFAGVIGIISLVIGLLFIIYSSHKSFALTMVVLGVIEMVLMFPAHIKYQQKVDAKIAMYKSGVPEFIKVETLNTENALKSFFRLKLLYGILIIILILVMAFLRLNSPFIGIFTALILHLALAITIDNFGEIYTKKYLTELNINKDKTNASRI